MAPLHFGFDVHLAALRASSASEWCSALRSREPSPTLQSSSRTSAAAPDGARAVDRQASAAAVGSNGGTGTVIAGASTPPSTWNTLPVTQEDASEAR